MENVLDNVQAAHSAKDFTTYEYKSVTVKKRQEPLYIDANTAFGWQVSSVTECLGSVTIAFKRSRSMAHKTELVRLQQKCEGLLAEYERLCVVRDSAGVAPAVSMGAASSLVLGGGMAMAMSFGAALFVPGIVIGCVGIAGVILPYFIFKAINKKKSRSAESDIEGKLDRISDVCQEAFRLMGQ